MTIVSVDKMWSRDNGTVTSPDGKTRSASFREGWQVVHSVDATQIEVVSATGLPKIGDLYDTTDYIFCTNQNPQRLGPIMTIVDIEYSGEIGPNNTSPINTEPIVSWSDAQSTEAIDQDINRRAIVTANGEPITGLTKEVADQVVTINRKFSLFNPFLTSLYRDSVSSDAFMGYPAGTARMIRFAASNVIDNNFGYWDVTASIQFRMPYLTSYSHAWSKRVRHEGFYERIGVAITFDNTGSTARGAVAAAVVAGGVITGIYLISGGWDYSTGTTVTITAPAGSGATATCSVNSTTGTIQSITVTNGGSGYTSKIVRAVDGHKEPTVKPVLLKSDGTRETNPANAVWLLVPVYSPLPYQALGLT